MRIGVLGGGLTGLALGSLLHCDFEILEKNMELGGLCRSLQEDGFTFDLGGSHIIFSKDNDVLEFMTSKLKDNIVKCRRNTKVFYKGRFIKYPFENGLSDLPLRENLECLYHFIRVKSRLRRLPPHNFKEWLYSTFGKGIAEKYLVPYNEKIWDYTLEKLSLEWVVNRVPQPPLLDVVKSSLGVSTEGYKHQLYFYYPRVGGIQALIKALEKDVNREFMVNFNVQKVTRKNGEWVVSNGEVEKTYDKLVSTIPLPHLVTVLNAPENVLAAVNDLRYNSLITVMLGLEEPKLNDISWLYFPRDEDGEYNRVSFPSNYSELVAPPGKSTLLAEITCKAYDGRLNRDDGTIVDHVTEALDRNKIIDRKRVCYSNVNRMQYAYVIYDENYGRNIQIVRDYVEKLGIELCGRFSQFEYLNMDACVRNAMNLAGKINHSLRA